MGLFGWWKRGAHDDAARQWHSDWEAAVDALDAGAAERLEARLRGGALGGPDTEVEEEMLEALRDVLALERDLAASQLPAIETTHRVAAGEPCHFLAPVSMPDDPAQPTGRLLFTSGRAVFAGGSRTPSLAWHAARQVLRADRDLILVRNGGSDGFRFRCNSYSDAVRGAAVARYLMRAARKPI